MWDFGQCAVFIGFSSNRETERVVVDGCLEIIADEFFDLCIVAGLKSGDDFGILKSDFRVNEVGNTQGGKLVGGHGQDSSARWRAVASAVGLGCGSRIVSMASNAVVAMRW